MLRLLPGAPEAQRLQDAAAARYRVGPLELPQLQHSTILQAVSIMRLHSVAIPELLFSERTYMI